MEDPRIAGIALLKNRHPSFLVKGLLLLISGIAPHFGWELIKNFISPGHKQLFKKLKDKTFYRIKTVNSQEFIDLLNSLKIDLVINARTRDLYKKNILNIPKLGCWNIHHGLLPEQRGLMCDFWSHKKGLPFGFSIHKMTQKLDDGDIFKVIQVGHGENSTDYLADIYKSARLEALAVKELMDSFESNSGFSLIKNQSEKVQYFKNPGLFDLFRYRWKNKRI